LEQSGITEGVDKLATEMSKNTEALKEYGYTAKSIDAKE
jgi:hypothetical protein